MIGVKGKEMDIRKIRGAQDDNFSHPEEDDESMASSNLFSTNSMNQMFGGSQPRKSQNVKKSKEDLQLEELEKKKELERKIKKTKSYINGAKRFVNLSDSLGKTPMHYAAVKGNLQLVK